MADFKQKFGTSTALTLTLASLASDTNLVAGRESTAVDNTTDLFVDVQVGGKVTTGTSPTAARQIEIWAYGSYDGTTYTAGATGSDANFAPIVEEKRQLRLLTVIDTTATSNVTYEWGPVSIAQAFGGYVPKKWGLYVVHNTAVNLNATGSNHEAKYTGIHIQSV